MGGTIGYVLIEDEYSVLDGLYMTLMTLTTVGFGEVHPLSTAGRVLTIGLIVTGVSLIGVTVSLLAQAIQAGELGERGRRRRMQRRIDLLSDHCIICGFGRVGRTVAEELARDAVNFVVIDRDEERERELLEQGVTYLIGDATNKEDLASAGIHRARAVISAVDDDAENIFITMVARSVDPNIWIVGRASQEETIDRLRTAGANRVFSPFVTAGKEMAYAAISPRVMDFFELEMEGAPSLRLEELQIEPGSHLVGRRLGDIRGDARVLAIRHPNGSVTTPAPDDEEVQDNDVLVLLGLREELRSLEEAR